MKNSKFLALLLSVLLIVVAFAACKESGETTDAADSTPDANVSDGEIAPDSTEPEPEPEAKGALVMATEATFPPYEYMQGIDVVGIDVDIANEIAKEMGVELHVENMNFDAVIPAVNSGKADFGAAGMSITEDRLKEVDFSIEYAESKQVIVTTADSGIQSEADLAGKAVGVQMGTVADLVLSDDYPDVNLVQAKKYTDIAMDLANGNIQAIVLDSLPAQEMIKNNDSFIILEDELFTDVYAICVAKGNDELLNTINTVLKRLIDEGKIVEYTLNHTA